MCVTFNAMFQHRPFDSFRTCLERFSGQSLSAGTSPNSNNLLLRSHGQHPSLSERCALRATRVQRCGRLMPSRTDETPRHPSSRP